MAIDSHHPLYAEFAPDWTMLRDCFRGERIVKSKGTLYLPPTSGMIQDGMKSANQLGSQAYAAYKMRARFPGLVRDAVEAALGVMHHKPPHIELPESMKPLMDKATLQKEGLPLLLRRINEEQLITGRCGLLADLPAKPQPGVVLPYTALYKAESIINWDQGTRDGVAVESLNLVVVNESEYERDADFEWKMQTKYRVLMLGDAMANELEGEGAIYRVGVFREDTGFNFNDKVMFAPTLRGKTLDLIPFTIINARDIIAEPEDSPLVGLAQLALHIYRGEADYRQSLFMQGQDTLVVIGGTSEDGYRTGANAAIVLPAEADAKYIGVDSAGLPELRTALENDYARAALKGGQLLDSVSRERESGDALKVRVAARTATLTQIALTSAFGLQEHLRKIAVWTGANPEEVLVGPNLDFIDDSLGGKELVEMMTAKAMGAPLSLESIHEIMAERGMTNKNFEEEIDLIEAEVVLVEAADPNGPVGSGDANPNNKPSTDDPELQGKIPKNK